MITLLIVGFVGLKSSNAKLHFPVVKYLCVKITFRSGVRVWSILQALQSFLYNIRYGNSAYRSNLFLPSNSLSFYNSNCFFRGRKLLRWHKFLCCWFAVCQLWPRSATPKPLKSPPQDSWHLAELVHILSLKNSEIFNTSPAELRFIFSSLEV